MFLNEEEIHILTGRKMKSLQIAALRQMGVAFRVNATGHPVVTKAAVEGRKEDKPPRPSWTPRALRTN